MLDREDRGAIEAALATAPPVRSIVDRLVDPGLHLIAEVKRASPSAGRIAADGEDIVARARAYQAGGASAISVLCEPHWFGGSVDDLRAVRAAVSVPVLAKEFVVDVRQLAGLRAAGADAVLLLVVLHPRVRALRALVDAALRLGLEPLVEAHDERELRVALETDARLIGINNRDLRTLAVDPERAGRLRALVPDDRLAIAESGVRDAATVARWRAQGFDAALVGEALVRAGDPAAVARSFVAAGAVPDDPANVARRPLVKICGVGDAGSALAAAALGADAIGLNLVPGTPRELSVAEAAELAERGPDRDGGRRATTDRRDHRGRLDDGARGDRRRRRPRRGPAQRERAHRRDRVRRSAGLEGAAPAGRGAAGRRRGRRRGRRARPSVADRRSGAPAARHGRRPASRRDRASARTRPWPPRSPGSCP